MSSIESDFLKLVRLGIGSARKTSICNSIDWHEIKIQAERQGLSAIIVDAIEKLPEAKRPSKDFMILWIGEVLQGYEYRCELYRRAIAEMARFYREHDLKMMLLKGYACSIEWPKPEHRPCGDIDIWMFGKQKDADALIASEKGVRIDKSHHHHTVFQWRDFMVENHYDFINVHHHKSNPELEHIFKELAKDDTHYIELYGERVYIPSVNLHALFLLKHAMSHFSSAELSIRQLLDWGFFAKNHEREIDWNWLKSTLDRFGMTPAFDLFNAICVEDLGIESSVFPYVQFNPRLKERILNDIFIPEYPGELPKSFFARLIYKIKRWRAFRWKHELCYNESLWSAFWSGIWNHLLKPNSI